MNNKHNFMPKRKMLIMALFFSLLGHLLIFTTFSVATFENKERIIHTSRIYFWGEFEEIKTSFPRQAIEKKDMLTLNLDLKEVKDVPNIKLQKIPPFLPDFEIPLEDILLPLVREESLLLREEKDKGEKKAPPVKIHILSEVPDK